MDKKIIVVGCDGYTIFRFDNLAMALENESIYFYNNTKMNRYTRTIETPKCKVCFKQLINPNTFIGLRADACFNVPKDIQCQINKDRKPTDIKMGLMEYIIKIEKNC